MVPMESVSSAFWGLNPQVINNPKWGATTPKNAGKFLSSILSNVEKIAEFKDEIVHR